MLWGVLLELISILRPLSHSRSLPVSVSVVLGVGVGVSVGMGTILLNSIDDSRFARRCFLVGEESKEEGKGSDSNSDSDILRKRQIALK